MGRSAFSLLITRLIRAASGRGHAKKSDRKTYKYSGGSKGSRIGKRTAGLKLETAVGRNKNAKSRKTGARRSSKMAKNGNLGSSDSSDLQTKKYIRKALELGLSSGYLIADENFDGQVLHVSSDIVRFGRCVEEGSGNDEKSDDSVTGGRGGHNARRVNGGKRLVTKNGRTNIRKRGRSRTKSPKKSSVPKRRRQRSDSRAKVKARIQKRKRLPEAKTNDESKTKKSEDDADDNDEDDEPGAEDNANKNSIDKNKKLSATGGRPGTVVPDSADKPASKNKNKKDGGKEASGEEGSSAEEDNEEEEDDQEQPDELAPDEDPNEDNEEQKTDD